MDRTPGQYSPARRGTRETLPQPPSATPSAATTIDYMPPPSVAGGSQGGPIVTVLPGRSRSIDQQQPGQFSRSNSHGSIRSGEHGAGGRSDAPHDSSAFDTRSGQWRNAGYSSNGMNRSSGHSGSASTLPGRSDTADAGETNLGDNLNTRKLFFQETNRRSTGPDWGHSPAKLIYYTSNGIRMEYELVLDETKIGRKADNNLVLPDPKVSKVHAIIYKSSEGFKIVDNNSSNGIRVNDRLIVPNQGFRLVDNDVILISSIALTFHDVNHVEASVTAKKNPQDEYLKLVTILSSDSGVDDSLTIRAELEAKEIDFTRVEDVDDVETLKEDYEKLRLAYELSKMSVTDDINKILAKSMDLIFGILPIDRGVVLLVDQDTGFLSKNYVKLRQGKANEDREILLSSTILKRVFYSRKCLITSDASEDPTLGKAASVRHGQIRSVICVPLIAHNTVHGILHLDSRDRINSFSNKDLSLVKSIGNQTAMVIENMNLIREVEKKARITEQLSRFLPPQVVDKMVNRSEIISKGGREMIGTVVFADIRGFTNLSEKSEPVEVVHLLNDYFERLVKIVFKYNGVIDKYIGDALMAVFGTLEDDQDAEFRAVAAALEFQEAIQDLNEERERNGKDPISIGVGANTGKLIAGFIGSSQRLEYTCIGDSVNTSSRICSMAQKDQVLISETTYEQIRTRIHCRPVGPQMFKGKNKEVMIYQAIKQID